MAELYWWTVYYTTLWAVYFIVYNMYQSLKLYLCYASDGLCFIVALLLYILSCCGALTVLTSNKWKGSKHKQILNCTWGMFLFMSAGVLVGMPVCVHSLIFVHVGELEPDFVKFWIKSYTNHDIYNGYFVFYCIETLLVFLASYVGNSIIINILRGK